MNRIRTILIVLLLTLSGGLRAQEPVYNVGVDGLACPFCAFGIEKQLQKLDGVTHLDTNLEEGHVIVKMQEGKTLDEAAVKQAVKKAGFTLRSFNRADTSS